MIPHLLSAYICKCSFSDQLTGKLVSRQAVCVCVCRPVKVMRVEPVALLNEAVPVQQLLIRLSLIPRRRGRHVVTTSRSKPRAVSQGYPSVSQYTTGNMRTVRVNIMKDSFIRMHVLLVAVGCHYAGHLRSEVKVPRLIASLFQLRRG